jgi:alpha-beta hydrolase superfamily lysophospholipase
MASTARSNSYPEIGTELVREWIPGGEPKAYIVLVHGIAEHSGRYERVGSPLADAGFLVRSFDLIGAGASGGRRWHIDDWSRYDDQVQSHMEWARDQGGPVVLMGHSMGGLIALGYVLDGRPKPDLLVLSAPALSGGAPWQRSLAPILSRLTPTLSIPSRVKGAHLSRDPAVGEAYFSDPLVITSATCALGAALFDEMDDVNERLADLNIPTLVIHGGDDRLVPTKSSEPLGALDCVDRKVYKGLRHETFNEPEGPQVMADVITWLNEKL